MCRAHTELYALKAIETGICYRLNRGTNLVGRNRKKCNIVLKHSTVSRVHCSFFFDRGNFRIVDLGSRNGIFVNGNRTRSKKLSVGDVIGIGRFRFQLISPTKPLTKKSGLTETNNRGKNREHNREVDLQPAPPSHENDVDHVAASSNNTRLAPLFGDSTEVEFFLDNDFDHEEESSDSVPCPNQYDVFPPERHQKRTIYPLRNQKRNRYQENWIASLPITIDFNNKRLRRVLFLMIALILCFVLKLVLYPVSSETEIFNLLQAELEAVKELRRNGAEMPEWRGLEIRIKNKNKSIIHYLEKNASAENQVQQELLRAARDCLPKLIQESRLDVSWHEKRFEKHMNTARLLLQNKDIAQNNYNSQFPTTPPGN